MQKRLKFIFLILLFIMICVSFVFYKTSTKLEKASYISSPNIINYYNNPKSEYIKDFLLAMLSPYITEAVKIYYTEPKSYSLADAKILHLENLEEGQFYFKIIIQVWTFEGAHNPPYGTETITIMHDIKGTYVKDYKHADGLPIDISDS